MASTDEKKSSDLRAEIERILNPDGEARVEIEKKVLRAMFHDGGRNIPSIVAELIDKDFVVIEHRKIFRALSECYYGGKAVSWMGVYDWMRENTKDADVVLIHRLAEKVEYDHEYHKYVEDIKKSAIKKRFSKAVTDALAKEPDVATLMSKQEAAVREARREMAAAIPLPFQSTAAYFDESFQQDVENSKRFSGRKTGFTGGGAFDSIDELQVFAPGLYILGGLTSIGKTSFAWQLAEQLAGAGEHVLFTSYEMEISRLRAKSVARALWMNNRHCSLTAIDILNGGTTASMSDIIGEIKSKYDRLLTFAPAADFDIGQLIATFEQWTASLDRPPVIFIDYLQYMRTGDKERRESVADAVRKLKDFQKRTGSTLIVLSSFNRENYTLPLSFESFKETGDIEYTADVIWGLQLNYVNQPFKTTFDARQAYRDACKEKPRKIELVCVKNRFGGRYECGFEYHSAHDAFIACPNWPPPQQAAAEAVERLKKNVEQLRNGGGINLGGWTPADGTGDDTDGVDGGGSGDRYEPREYEYDSGGGGDDDREPEEFYIRNGRVLTADEYEQLSLFPSGDYYRPDGCEPPPEKHRERGERW